MHEKILIVEDDLELAEMLRLYYEQRGYRMATVAFGEEAVTQTNAWMPDLVILDIFLPDIDGYEVCRRLRAQQRTSHIPILFLTGKRGREAKIAGLELGAVDYIVKPFDMPELAARIESILRRSGFRPLDHPVSGLPGDQLFAEHRATLRGQAGWTLTRVELENLEAVGEAYGFVARDDLLRAVALTLQEVGAGYPHPAGFAAHTEQSVFYLISGAPDANELHARLAERLYQTIAPFYPHRDREDAGSAGAPQLTIYAGSVGAAEWAGDESDNLLKLAQGARRKLASVP